MPVIFNVFTGNLDYIDQGGTLWLSPVADELSLPLTDPDGSVRVVLDQNVPYVFDVTGTQWHRMMPLIIAPDISSTANGISITEVDTGDITNFSIKLHPADGINPGIITTGTQTIAGDKTLSGTTTALTTKQTTVQNASGTDTLIVGTLDGFSRPQLWSPHPGLIFKLGSSTADVDPVNAVSEGIVVHGKNTAGDPQDNSNVGYARIKPDRFGLFNLDSSIGSSTYYFRVDTTSLFLATEAGVKQFEVTRSTGATSIKGALNMNGQPVNSVADPVSPQDAATKTYVDNAIAGLSWKLPVKVATTANIILSGEQTIDGILTNASRVLVKDQSIGSQNGIYVSNVGAWSRSSDANSTSEVEAAAVFVQQGTVNSDIAFVQTADPVVLDTTSLVFVPFSTTYLTGHDMVTISGGQISVDLAADAGLESSNPGNASGQLRTKLDGVTLTRSASGLKLTDTAVIPATYGSASQVGTFTVDQQGRLTAASNTTIIITSGAISDFTEAVQDAVGASLTDTSSIDLTYDDILNTVSGVVLPAGVNHDALLNFVANKHIDHTLVNINTAANSGLAGGGDISSSRSLVVDVNNATAETVTDNADTILIYDNSATALRKQTRSNFLGAATPATGDIGQTSFTVANNQIIAANVTGLAFANGSVRSARVQYSIFIDATSDLYESGELELVQRGADWVLSQESTGDNSLVVFDVDTSGQVTYTSSAYTGYINGTMKFRAMVTNL